VPLITAIGVVVLALLLGAAGVYWQHGLVTDRDATIASLQGEVTRLGDQLSVQESKVAVTQQTVLKQQELIQGLRTSKAALRLRYRIAVGNEQAAQQALTQSQAQSQAAQQALTQSQAQLQAANETVQTMVGPQLADGRYVGYLMAVGSQQSTPRLVIDRAKMVPGQGLVNAHPAWHTVRVSPAASVVVLSLRPYYQQRISLDRLAHLFVNPAPWADRVTHAPFRITVSGGIVTAIREFRPTV
jgi:hypothetical protein